MAEALHPPPAGPRANPDPPAPRQRPSRIFRRLLSSAVRTDYRVADFGAALGAGLGGILGTILGAPFLWDIPETYFGYFGKMPVTGLLPLFGGMVGLVFGAIFGAIAVHWLSAFTGAFIGGLAWVFDGPQKGALRCGVVFATLMGLFGLGVVIASAPDWSGAGLALGVFLTSVTIGGFGGAALGASLGWLGRPIFREFLEELEKSSA